MALKGGQILHVGNGVTVIDRIQTAGPGNLNIPEEKIYELGNYESVGTIRDVPDLSFNLESFDASTEIEFMLCGASPGATFVNMNTVKPLDMVSPFKAGKDQPAPYDIIAGVALPYLATESVSYRFGLRDNARQTITLRGDSIFYCPGTPKVQVAAGTGAAGQAIVLAEPAGAYSDASSSRRVLSVTVNGMRLTPGVEYTMTPDGSAAGFESTTVTLRDAVPASQDVRIVYFTNTATVYPQTVHEGTTVKPAALRGRDIDVFIGAPASGAPFDIADPNWQAMKWTGVQSLEVDWRVTLEKDEEFGNYFATANDFDVPDLSGNVEIRPRDVPDLFRKIRQAAGITADDVAVGTNLAAQLPLNVALKNPETGAIIKRLEIKDARFSTPGYSGTANQRVNQTMSWSSDSGNLLVHKG